MGLRLMYMNDYNNSRVLQIWSFVICACVSGPMFGHTNKKNIKAEHESVCWEVQPEKNLSEQISSVCVWMCERIFVDFCMRGVRKYDCSDL